MLVRSVFTIQKVNDKTVPGGTDGKLLDCLAEKLNFEFEILTSPGGGTRYRNGTWNGIIGLVQKEEADMGFGILSLSEERLEVVDFSNSYMSLEKIFTVKEPGQMPKITAFTYPFTRNVWILYALMILAATVLFQRIMFRNATLLGSFVSVLGSIVTQGMENVKDSPWRRVLFGLWLTIAAIMPFLYNTNFLSFLTMPEKIPTPKNFQELSELVSKGKYKCLTPKQTMDMDLLLESGIDYLENLGEAIKKNDWFWSYLGVFEDLFEDRVAVIIARTGLRLRAGSPPFISLKESDDSFGIWHSGIALKKGFCCRERLNDVLYGIINGGLYEKWVNDYAFGETIRKRLDLQHEEPQLQLTLQDLKLAFFTLFIGYALALLAFLGEILIPKGFAIFYS
ncbi:lig_chan-Glu_bd domain-containing protein [Trichonephila inaurata madagascariensis]|uniref:Lig_chan-Glu_bd domain-containing protein n=1 Tax=Trichonephila inaurata madagascariensis TaxID=2747483 RepID=A0A8X7BPU7_9ARAC|nr:lig_chan-Glu_bd domain-containing protein [Trichonephila inaurata madagascariensis]